MVSKDEGEVIEDGIITLKGKMKMVSNSVQGKENLRFISLLSKFPKLLINVYSQIKGEDGIKHHIKLKESVPIAQMLQQSEIVQKRDLKALLQASFIKRQSPTCLYVTYCCGSKAKRHQLPTLE